MEKSKKVKTSKKDKGAAKEKDNELLQLDDNFDDDISDLGEGLGADDDDVQEEERDLLNSSLTSMEWLPRIHVGNG